MKKVMFMMLLILAGFTSFIFSQIVGEFPILKGEYLGQKPPGLIPEIFAPNLISGKGRMHCFPAFSQDQKEIIWMELPPKIMIMKEISEQWTPPEAASFLNEGIIQAPFIAHDNTIYFSTVKEDGYGSLDIWYIVKTDSGYSVPKNIGNKLNTDKLQTHPTLSKNKTIFYTGFVEGKLYNRGIYCSNIVKGEYTDPILLPEPINIMNDKHLDYTPFIAPDESYLLFCSNRQNPDKELCHIYISYKDEHGEWNDPIDLSLKMNFEESSKFPYVSPDNKFLFFSSGKNIYWVSTDILEKL